jgi:AraC-like DNA-binding protein
MIVWGPGITTTAHRHHCVQLMMTLRGTLRVRGGRNRAWKRCGAVLVRPDAVHEVDARGGTVVIGFIDAESEIGGALSDGIEGQFACVPSRRVARWRAVLGPTPNEARVTRWLTKSFVRRQRETAIHPGVRRVLSHLREQQALLDDASLKTLAAIAGLSPSRFMHAFTESVGVPVRPYILWLRLQQAACDLTNGTTVTSAAHRAGFADGAHLTRTFRRMLGLTPSDLALRSRLTFGFRTTSPRASEAATSNQSKPTVSSAGISPLSTRDREQPPT